MTNETIPTKTLRPGMLVSLKTSVVGGVKYERNELEAEHTTEAGERRAKWETTKTVEDAQEFELATKVRGKCRSVVSAVCAASEFGLLCPTAKAEDLAERVAAARRLADEFNAQSKVCTVSVYVITGRINPDDAEAVRAINSELTALLNTMESGVRSANVETIRDAALRAKRVGAMLTDQVQARVNLAVQEARAAATEIAKRVARDGEEAARVVSEIRLDAVQAARAQFLDLDAPAEIASVDVAPQAAALEIPEGPEGWTEVEGGVVPESDDPMPVPDAR